MSASGIFKFYAILAQKINSIRRKGKIDKHGGAGAEHRQEVHGGFRTKVRSMSGGPYCRMKHWKCNTAITMTGIFLICIPITMKSAELKVLQFFIFYFTVAF